MSEGKENAGKKTAAEALAEARTRMEAARAESVHHRWVGRIAGAVSGLFGLGGIYELRKVIDEIAGAGTGNTNGGAVAGVAALALSGFVGIGASMAYDSARAAERTASSIEGAIETRGLLVQSSQPSNVETPAEPPAEIPQQHTPPQA